MKHDFRRERGGNAAELFRSWLESETINTLRLSVGDAEGTKAAIFLFVNRAFEAHLAEEEVGEMFGRCFVRSGQREAEQEVAFDWLEFFTKVAIEVHSRR